jgi:hypothetical protein
MALILANRVQETATANTTVSFSLAGASTGYTTFSSTVGNTNTTYYGASDGTNWEVGIGTYATTGNLLNRTTILASSNAGSAVTFSGTVTVFIDYPSSKSVYLDASGNASALGTPASGVVTNLTGTASININGTVGATTATTGAFTTVSATGVITSTLATGTAPFTVASTTQVANLNAATAGTATSSTTATNLAGGALGSVPYQNAAGTTLFLAGTTSTTPSFVTSTGTGTLTQAPTLTSSTGSGNVVLATSPTLVTPALGTPSALVGTNITGTATSFNINGTVGATTPAAGTFTQLTVNGSNVNTSISPTGTGTVAISPAGALTINPTAASTINNTSIGATTRAAGAFTTLAANNAFTLTAGANNSSITTTGAGTITISSGTAGSMDNINIGATTAGTGSFTSLTATSVGTAGVLAKTGGKTAVTAISATTSLTTGGTTLASQSMATGATWRVVAYGTFAAASSATSRTFTMACFWGSTQLTAITTGAVLASTAQTTPWKVEFEITGSSATAAWVTGFLSAQVTSATIPLNYAATAASTTSLTTTSTLDIRFANGTSAVDAINVQQVTIERLV